VLLQQGKILIFDIVDLSTTDEHMFGTALDACQGTVPVSHFGARVFGDHFRVTGPAYAAANLSGPRLLSALRKSAEAHEQADTA
jgi:hypothetical protein